MSSSAMIKMSPATEAARERWAFENTFVVRRGGPLLSDRAAGTVAGCFPELFPFGRGGPDECRAVPMSLRSWCRRMAMDGSRRFAQHQLFPLVSYDMVGRATMLSRGALHVRFRPAVHDPIARLTVAELKSHLEQQEAGREARRRDCNPVPLGDATGASVFMKEVFATMSRYPGSNEERAVWRQEAYALTTRFGFPHLFFTVTPDDVNSLTVMLYTGAMDADMFFDADTSGVPSHSVRLKVVSKDPVADARFFERTLRVIVRVLLGWDVDAQRAVEGGGVFGIVKAFFGVVETQGRGSLHAHNLVWVRGMPPTVEQITEALHSDPAFCKRFLTWADSVSSAVLPLSDEAVACPVCSSEVVARDVPMAAQRKQATSAREPYVAVCTRDDCHGRLTSTEILAQQVRRHRAREKRSFASARGSSHLMVDQATAVSPELSAAAGGVSALAAQSPPLRQSGLAALSGERSALATGRLARPLAMGVPVTPSAAGRDAYQGSPVPSRDGDGDGVREVRALTGLMWHHWTRSACLFSVVGRHWPRGAHGMAMHVVVWPWCRPYCAVSSFTAGSMSTRASRRVPRRRRDSAATFSLASCRTAGYRKGLLHRAARWGVSMSTRSTPCCRLSPDATWTYECSSTTRPRPLCTTF